MTQSPTDYVKWFKEDPNHWQAWNAKHLATDLKPLKNGTNIVHPVTKDRIYANKIIIFDTGLGKWHEQTGRYIDFQVFLDTPADISLVRRSLRSLKNGDMSFAPTVDNLHWYLTEGRPLFLNTKNLKNNSNMIIPGELNIDTIVNQVYKRVSILLKA